MFHELHQAAQPLLIANAWDVPSARAAEEAGYTAIGTSSAAIAAMLGYADGEGMPFSDLLRMVERIRATTTLPLSVDIEAGYGDAAGNAARLADLGVAGINIEDSVVADGKRTLVPPQQLADQISAVRAAAPGLFINARTDPFLIGLGDALQQTIARGHLYVKHGADGVFAPCITATEDIRELTGAIAKPVNVMCMPALPDFATLASLGVKRISMGNFVHGRLQLMLKEALARIRAEQSFASVFAA
jgi:2-methylisocitrate lyase-like PEP mutase family enzyme